MSKRNRTRPYPIEKPSRGRRKREKFHLSTRQKIIFGLVVALSLAAISLYLWKISEISRETYVESCLESAYTSVKELGPAPIRNLVIPGYQWKEVSAAATDQIFTLAHPRNCNGINPKPPLLDRWGNRIRLAVREKPSGEIELKLKSNGPDAVPETKDDINVPRIAPSD
jgi:hypothetical protein